MYTKAEDLTGFSPLIRAKLVSKAQGVPAQKWLINMLYTFCKICTKAEHILIIADN